MSSSGSRVSASSKSTTACVEKAKATSCGKASDNSSWSSCADTQSLRKQTSQSTTPLASSPTEGRQFICERRPSLLSSGISKEECTFVDIGDPDGTPRLISYLASGQGFIWNPEIFIPAYLDSDYIPIDERRDQVHEVHLTEEEMADMIPR